jgi:transposase
LNGNAVLNQPSQSLSDVADGDSSSTARRKRGRPRSRPAPVPSQPAAGISEVEHSGIINDNDELQSQPRPRGRPKGVKVPVRQRVVQPEFNEQVPVIAARLQTPAGRQTLITRPRRCRRIRARPPRSPSPPKHKYTKVEDDEAWFVVQRRCNHEESIVDVQQAFKEQFGHEISEDQIYKIAKRLSTRGTVAKLKPKGAKRQFDDSDFAWFSQYRLTHPDKFAREVRSEFVTWRDSVGRPVPEHKKLKILSDATQSKWLKEMLATRTQIHREVPSTNSQASIDARFSYAVKALAWADENVVYVDEAGFNHEVGRSFGYSRVGTTPVITGMAKGARLNVLAAMSSSRVLYIQCTFSTVDGTVYRSFLSEMIKKAGHLFESKNIHIVQDGAQFHKMDIVKEVVTSQRLEHYLETIPAHSSALNAIEQAWLQVRRNASDRADQLLSHQKSLQQIIEESFWAITPEQVAGYHQSVKNTLASCLERRPIGMNSSSDEHSTDSVPLQYLPSDVNMSNQ